MLQIVLKPEHIQLATGSYAKSHLAPLGFLQKYTQTSANQATTTDGLNSDGSGLTLAPAVLPCINPSELLTALLEKEEQNKTTGSQNKRKGGHNSDPSKRVKSDNSSQQGSTTPITTTPALNDYVPLGPSGHNSEGEQEEESENDVLAFRDAKVAKEKADKPEKVIIMTDKKRKVNEISEKVIKAIKNKR